MWMLGSSGFGAQVASTLGWPFAFAHHFSPANTLPALELYRTHFTPSDRMSEPCAMIAVSVLAAESDEQAEYLAGSGRLGFLRLRTGRPGPFPSPEEAATHQFTPAEDAAIRGWTGSHIVGGPETVRAGLLALRERTGANELMITTNAYEHADRVRSYEIVADLFR